MLQQQTGAKDTTDNVAKATTEDESKATIEDQLHTEQYGTNSCTGCTGNTAVKCMSRDSSPDLRVNKEDLLIIL
jgi:hypothetical protein